MSEPKKFPCPICGQIIQKQGQAGHNRSKFHIAALEKLNAANNESDESPKQQEPQQDVSKQKSISEPEIKPVAPIAPPEIKSGFGETAPTKSGGFLDWVTEDDPDF